MESIPGVPNPNMLLAAGTALIPLLLGFIWYNPKVFGKPWMTAAGLTPDSAKGMNMVVVFGLTYVFGFFLSMFLHFWSIHQFAFSSLMQPELHYTNPAGFEEAIKNAALISEHKFRTFRHGAVHGLIMSVMVALPLTAIGALFERRGWKYILINWGYWAVNLTLMAGIICQWA
jgi:hypothetical protein